MAPRPARSGSVPLRRREHVLLVSRGAAPVRHRLLRDGSPSHRRVSQRLPPGGAGDRNRHRKLRRRHAVRREDRVRLDSLGGRRHERRRLGPGASRIELPDGALAAGGTRVRRRILRRPCQRADPASTSRGKEGGRHRPLGVPVVRGDRRGLRHLLGRHALPPHHTAPVLLLDGDPLARRDDLHARADAGRPPAPAPLVRRAHGLPDGRAGGREHPEARRCAARAQSRIDGRRGPRARLDGTADSFPHVQGSVRASADQAVREDPPRHSDLVAAGPSRDAPLAAGGHRVRRAWGARLHLPRRGADAHRADAAVPSRHGAHHEERRCAHRSGEHRWDLGIDLQLFRRPLPLEVAAQAPVSGPGDLRPSDAGDDDGERGPRRRSGARCLRIRSPETPDAHASALVHSDRTPPSAPVRHGRRENARAHVPLGARQVRLSRTPLARGVARRADGRDPAPPVRAGSARQHGGAPHGQGSRQPQLHGVEGDAGRLRRPVPPQDGDQLASLPREGPHRDARGSRLRRGSRGSPTPSRTHRGLGDRDVRSRAMGRSMRGRRARDAPR